jgi:N-acetylglucosaminyl-diphospho-decaprenol L-rhamnosyltransferase
MRSVAVAIPHTGHTENLERCLDALERDPKVAEVAVVLPRNAVDSRLALERRQRCTTIVTPELQSFAVATNKAVAESSAPYVLLLNDDAMVRPGAVCRLASYLDDHPEAGATAPKLLNPDGSLQPSLYHDPTLWAALEELMRPVLPGPLARRIAHNPRPSFPTRPTSVHWAAAAALLVRRSLFQRLGGLDERYPHGMEDAALCLEIRRAGARVVAVPQAEVVHAKGASSFRHPDAAQMGRVLTRGVTSWVLYMRIYRPRHALPVRLIFLLHALMRYTWFSTFGRLRSHGYAAVQSSAYRRHLRTLVRTK